MKKRGFTKIGMISGTDGFGASMQAQCKSVIGDYGIEIVAEETYDPKDADMTAQLTKIRRGHPGCAEPGLRAGAVDRDAQLWPARSNHRSLYPASARAFRAVSSESSWAGSMAETDCGGMPNSTGSKGISSMNPPYLLGVFPGIAGPCGQ